MHKKTKRVKIGLALGSGSARGWAHIGVINALNKIGIKPDIVCGTSIGALVGGMYVTDHLDTLHQWILTLDKREIIKYLDINLLTGGGFVEGKSIINFFQDHMGDQEIESLRKTFASVATELDTGKEVWIQSGSILESIRASMAIPGIFTPVNKDGIWLVDGGIVNPVPISVCRALGADKVIAVNLNGDIVGKHTRSKQLQSLHPTIAEETLISRFAEKVKGHANHYFPELFEEGETAPGLFEVMASSINIMQDRITRSRMAGDPPDILLSPKLASIGLMDFDKAAESITAGEKAVHQVEHYLLDMINDQ